MSATTDFQSMARQACQDQPDARLFSLIDAFADRDAVYQASTGGKLTIAAAMVFCHAGDALVAEVPQTIDGMTAKLRVAEALMWKCPGAALLNSALCHALTLLESCPSNLQPPALIRKGAR